MTLLWPTNPTMNFLATLQHYHNVSAELSSTCISQTRNHGYRRSIARIQGGVRSFEQGWRWKRQGWVHILREYLLVSCLMICPSKKGKLVCVWESTFMVLLHVAPSPTYGYFLELQATLPTGLEEFRWMLWRQCTWSLKRSMTTDNSPLFWREWTGDQASGPARLDFHRFTLSSPFCFLLYPFLVLSLRLHHASRIPYMRQIIRCQPQWKGIGRGLEGGTFSIYRIHWHHHDESNLTRMTTHNTYFFLTMLSNAFLIIMTAKQIDR